MKNRVQKVRWRKGWSQSQLARISGVPQSVICKIENENGDFNLSTALKLSKALSCKPSFLFYFTELEEAYNE